MDGEMREIKFRVWEQNIGLMAYPSDKLKMSGDYGFSHLSQCFDIDDRHIELASQSWDVEHEGKLPCILMQYTGLKDKNGKEIYEGDILSEDYLSSDNSMGILPNGWSFEKGRDNFEVIWDNEIGGWTFKFDEEIPEDVKKEFGDYSDMYMNKWKNHARHILVCGNEGIGEVIGNIYENPNLI